MDRPPKIKGEAKHSSRTLAAYASLLTALSLVAWAAISISSSQLAAIDVAILIVGGAVIGWLGRSLTTDTETQDVNFTANYDGTRLRSLINSMADAVIATDNHGEIQLYNPAALLLLNTNQTIQGKQITKLLPLTETTEEQPVDIIDVAKSAQRIVKRDDLIFTNNRGENINLYLDIAPIRVAHNNDIDGYIFLLRDITVQKTLEEQRDDFISIVSHELRTPITIAEASLSTTMLPSMSDPERQTKMIAKAHDNILFLAQLVNDITTLAHAERGDLVGEQREVDIKELVSELAGNYTKPATEQGLKLKTDVDDDLPIVVTHRQRLVEIMQDYITNAIKYTEEGSITICASHLGNGLVRLGVKDTGIGMSSSDIAHVFEKFYRSEDYRTRNHSGTGLGLYIAKKLSQLIGVELGVESELNQGSFFYIDIPVDQDNDQD